VPSVGAGRALAAPVATIAPGVAATVAAPGLIAPGELVAPAARGTAAAGADAPGGVAFGALAAGVGAEAGWPPRARSVPRAGASRRRARNRSMPPAPRRATTRPMPAMLPKRLRSGTSAVGRPNTSRPAFSIIGMSMLCRPCA
jgi:hypothetical protein